MKASQWYVLTGGPCSGKTTLLQKLEEKGYHTVPEAARMIIEEYAQKGIFVEELRKDESNLIFQEEVVQKKLELEMNAPNNKIIFYDRGITDCIAYYQMIDTSFFDEKDKLVIDKQIKDLEKLSINRYHKIFFLELLPFQQDNTRKTENENIAKQLNDLILQAYQNLNYTPIIIPPVSVEERLKLIRENL